MKANAEIMGASIKNDKKVNKNDNNGFLALKNSASMSDKANDPQK